VGRSGYGCSYSVQLLEAFSPVEVVWTGRGGVVLCKRIGCSLLQAIFSLNLVFGVANRGFQVFWNNKDYLLASFFCNQSLWFAAIWLKLTKSEMGQSFLKRSKESRGKEGGEAYFVYSTHFMAGKFRSETEKILKIDLIYGESVTRIDNWHWRSCSQSWQVGGSYLWLCS